MSRELSNLQAPEGANKKVKRKGRGPGSGHGKQAGRGTKGQKARKSGHVRIGFEGGQMPLQRRLPKMGFLNPFTKNFAEVNVGDLVKLQAGGVVDEAALREAGLVKGRWDGVKILGNGDLSVAVSLKVNRISKGAKEKVEKAGGKIELIPDREKWARTETRAQKRAAKKTA
jgi:large subunit ribosomal protein L15